MQVNDYDFRKIWQEFAILNKRIKDLEDGIADLKIGWDDYNKKYKEQPISEWLESISPEKQIGSEE